MAAVPEAVLVSGDLRLRESLASRYQVASPADFADGLKPLDVTFRQVVEAHQELPGKAGAVRWIEPERLALEFLYGHGGSPLFLPGMAGHSGIQTPHRHGTAGGDEPAPKRRSSSNSQVESVSAHAVQPESRPFSRCLASQVSKIGRASSHSPMVFQ